MLLAAVTMLAVSVEAQDAGSMLMVDAGYASVHDSYLTPITYDGWTSP